MKWNLAVVLTALMMLFATTAMANTAINNLGSNVYGGSLASTNVWTSTSSSGANDAYLGDFISVNNNAGNGLGIVNIGTTDFASGFASTVESQISANNRGGVAITETEQSSFQLGTLNNLWMGTSTNTQGDWYANTRSNQFGYQSGFYNNAYEGIRADTSGFVSRGEFDQTLIGFGDYNWQNQGRVTNTNGVFASVDATNTEIAYTDMFYMGYNGGYGYYPPYWNPSSIIQNTNGVDNVNGLAYAGLNIGVGQEAHGSVFTDITQITSEGANVFSLGVANFNYLVDQDATNSGWYYPYPL